MSENMYCNDQKGNSDKFREGWDRIWGKEKESKEGEKNEKEEKK